MAFPSKSLFIQTLPILKRNFQVTVFNIYHNKYLVKFTPFLSLAKGPGLTRPL